MPKGAPGLTHSLFFYYHNESIQIFVNIKNRPLNAFITTVIKASGITETEENSPY